MPIVGPAEVHPEEHLRPVRGLGAAGAGADRQDRGLLVVLAREQELGPLAIEVPPEGLALTIALGDELGVSRFLDQLAEGLEVRRAGEEPGPQLDLGAEGVGFAKDLLRRPLVVPEGGRAGQALELGESLLSGWEVKDAPRSTGSARPGRGRRQRPSVSDLEILEQDRTELDQSEGRLAPGDDGVHAGTVAVVGADAAVAVAIEGRCIAAGAAVAFAGDEIHKGAFLGLLHAFLFPHTATGTRAWAGATFWVDAGGAGVSGSICGLFPYAKREKCLAEHESCVPEPGSRRCGRHARAHVTAGP
jgi:hypothetical protein